MPRARRSSEKTNQKTFTVPRRQAEPEVPKKPAAKTPEELFEERPDIQFARDFDPDLTFAFQWEAAQEMESEHEDELERALVEDAEASTWGARIMRQSWGADPVPKDLDDYQRFRMTPDAYQAMKVNDPLEAMLFAQASALHTNMIFAIGQATRFKSRETEKEEPASRYYTHAVKLAGAFGKHMETLKRYRSNGQQKMVVKYERQDRGHQSRTKVSRTEKHRLTVSKTRDLDADFEKPSPGAETVPLNRSGKGATNAKE